MTVWKAAVVFATCLTCYILSPKFSFGRICHNVTSWSACCVCCISKFQWSCADFLWVGTPNVMNEFWLNCVLFKRKMREKDVITNKATACNWMNDIKQVWKCNVCTHCLQCLCFANIFMKPSRGHRVFTASLGGNPSCLLGEAKEENICSRSGKTPQSLKSSPAEVIVFFCGQLGWFRKKLETGNYTGLSPFSNSYPRKRDTRSKQNFLWEAKEEKIPLFRKARR